MSHQKTTFMAVIVALALLGGVAVIGTYVSTPAHAVAPCKNTGGPCFSGPGSSQQVSSPSETQCLKKSPGNSSCNG